LLAVLQAGGIPVICDTDPITWELSIESIKAGIQEFGKPKVPVHFIEMNYPLIME
jgi:dTDP-4-amino-4,6-dideoxygalactose transaminase